MLGLIESLRKAVDRLSWSPDKTLWSGYYSANNYSDEAMTAKEQCVARFLERSNPKTVWDLGANTGRFSRLASARGAYTAAFDADPGAVELAFRDAAQAKDPCLLPLWMDLSNPSPALGWAHRERESLVARGPADLVLALALVHHLAIGNNVPLPRLAEFFAETGRILIAEFIPKRDSQAQRLLAAREDVFPHYTRAGFEKAFEKHFTIEDTTALPDSERCVYLMQRRT